MCAAVYGGKRRRSGGRCARSEPPMSPETAGGRVCGAASGGRRWIRSKPPASPTLPAALRRKTCAIGTADVGGGGRGEGGGALRAKMGVIGTAEEARPAEQPGKEAVAIETADVAYPAD